MKNKILPTCLQGNYGDSLGEFSNTSYGAFEAERVEGVHRDTYRYGFVSRDGPQHLTAHWISKLVSLHKQVVYKQSEVVWTHQNSDLWLSYFLIYIWIKMTHTVYIPWQVSYPLQLPQQQFRLSNALLFYLTYIVPWRNMLTPSSLKANLIK